MIGPAIESFISQTIVINIFFLLKDEYEYKIGLPVIVSGILFGLFHWGVADTIIDNIIKVIGASLIGIVLSYSYVIFHLSNRKATFIQSQFMA